MRHSSSVQFRTIVFTLGLAVWGSGVGEFTGSKDSPAGQVSARDGEIKKKKKPEIVTAKVYFSVDRLPPGKTCQVMIVLQISHPWHINANPAGDEFALPTEWTLKSKYRVKLSRVRYPKGKKLTVPGFEEPLFVYTKQAVFRGTLEIPATAAGKKEELRLRVRYQACDDRRCLRPTVLAIKVPVQVAAEGESVKAINPKLFRRKKK